MPYTDYMPPVGGGRQSYPELTDHCRPGGEATFAELHYTASGPCRRCGAIEE
jgi:hypothetical protein